MSLIEVCAEPRYGHTAAVFLGCATNESQTDQVGRRFQRGFQTFRQEIVTCLREKPADILNMLDLPMEVKISVFQKLSLQRISVSILQIMTQPVVDGDFSLSTDPFLPKVITSSYFCIFYVISRHLFLHLFTSFYLFLTLFMPYLC